MIAQHLAIDLIRRCGGVADAASQGESCADAVLGVVHRVGEVSGSVWNPGELRKPLDDASMGAEGSGAGAGDNPAGDGVMMSDVAQPVFTATPVAPGKAADLIPAMLLGIWACGFVAIASLLVPPMDARPRQCARGFEITAGHRNSRGFLDGAHRTRSVRHLSSRPDTAGRDSRAS